VKGDAQIPVSAKTFPQLGNTKYMMRTQKDDTGGLLVARATLFCTKIDATKIMRPAVPL